MSVKRYQTWDSDHMAEIDGGPYVLYSDYAALEKRLAETEVIAKESLSKAPAYAEEVRRLGREVVELTKALQACVDHEVDYMTRNHLGDPENQSYVIQARKALGQPHAEAFGDSGEFDLGNTSYDDQAGNPDRED